MSSFKKIKKASKYADCKNSGKESLLKYYGVKTERRESDSYRKYHSILQGKIEDVFRREATKG